MATIDTTKTKPDKAHKSTLKELESNINSKVNNAVSEAADSGNNFGFPENQLTEDERTQLESIRKLEPLIRSGRLDINARYEDNNNSLIESAVENDQPLLAIFLFNSGAKIDMESAKMRKINNKTAEVLRFAVSQQAKK